MAMQLDKRAEDTLHKILESFRKPEELPAKMARVFLESGDRYSARWSARNQFIVFMMGHSDAATFGTWKKRGRCVRKGERSFGILKPVFRRFPVEWELDEDGQETDKVKAWGRQLVGFESWAVFGKAQTDIIDEALDAKFSGEDAMAYLETLPLRDVAEKLGVSISAGGENGQAYGWFTPSTKNITVCVEGFQTWLHELFHADEGDRGVLVEGKGQDPGNEISAELGSLVLMNVLGYADQADTTRTYEYVASYMNEEEDQLMAGHRLMGRIMDGVQSILTRADLWETPQQPE